MADVKRLNFFLGQFLEVQDFLDEQQYHLDMRRRINRGLFQAGVLDGLDVVQASPTTVTVAPGHGIGPDGREMVVLTARTVEVTGPPSSSVFLVMTYEELPTDSRTADNYTGATRVIERPKIEAIAASPSGAQVQLARVDLDGARRIVRVDSAQRAIGGLRPVGDLILNAGRSIRGAGRVHVFGEELLYLLNRQGVVIGKEWGGNGNLSVQGDVSIGGSVTSNLSVQGQLSMAADLAIAGKVAMRGNDMYLRLNQEGAFANGVHTPFFLSAGSMSVGGVNSWNSPGANNLAVTGEIQMEHLGTIRNKGRLHIFSEETTYLLAKGGVNVSSAWGGGGTLNVDGDTTIRGTLTVGEQEAMWIFAHDLAFGHSGRRGSPGRALVDNTRTLVLNYGTDWPDGVRYGGTLSQASSRSLKEDIAPLESAAAQAIVSGLDPVQFSLRADDTKARCLGFIAEDVPAEIATADRQAVVVNHVVAALTRVVKDQQLVIETLEARLAKLELAELGRQGSRPARKGGRRRAASTNRANRRNRG